MTKGSENVFPQVILSEGSTPATPAGGQVKLFATAGAQIWTVDDAGAVVSLGVGFTPRNVLVFPFMSDDVANPIAANAELWVPAPYDGDIIAWSIAASPITGETVGDIVIDVWADDGASWPPTNADALPGSAEPEIAAGLFATDDTTGWSAVSVLYGDWIKAHVDSCADLESAVLALVIERTG